MKKLIASVGLAALGTATLSAQYAPGLSPQETTKPFSISASLRGFYDDNINTQPSEIAIKSWGMEFSPSASLNFAGEQSYARIGYVYSLKYFEADDRIDHSHEISGKLEHRLSERFKLGVSDKFTYAQEPDVIADIGGIRTVSTRAGNVIHNNGSLNFTGQLTPEFSLEASYDNNYYKYQKSPFSETLNRFEHKLSLDGGYQIQENLMGFLGYSYAFNDYTSDDIIEGTELYDSSYTLIPGSGIRGKDKNSQTHYFFGGLKQELSSQLSGSVKVGASLTTYDTLGDDTWNPYADANLTYTYLPGSSIQIGVRHDRNATDATGATVLEDGTEDFTRDQESTTVYGQLTHAIEVNLIGSLSGQFQNSKFSGGAYDGSVDNIFSVGANLEYKFSQYVSTEVGYNFDRLDSDLDARSYSRNRVYFGFRASY
jgi:hypothetical protein